MFTKKESELLLDIIAEEKRVVNHCLEHRVEHHSIGEKKLFGKILLLNNIERKVIDGC